MQTTLLIALSLAAAPAAGMPAAGMSRGSDAGARVLWKGKHHSVDALPEEMPEPAARAIGLWSGWAGEHGYRMALDPEGRVLFVSASSTSRPMKGVARTVAFFDEHLPAPPRETVDDTALSARTGGDSIPEDSDDVIPEDPDDDGGVQHGGDLQRALYGWTEQWGAGAQALDRDTITLFAIQGEEDYAGLLDHLAELAPYLAGWVEQARGNLGFVLEQPLAGAWVFGGAGQEEWSPDGELVHRLSELLLARRFGRQPYWLVQGWAWHAEMELRGAVYCYPYRDEFVYEAEHAAWPSDLRALAGSQLGSLDAATVGALRRGVWSGRNARLAYGTVAWIARERGQPFPGLLEDLRLAWDEGSRVQLSGRDWERDVDYEVEPETQGRLFRKHLGEDVYAELLAGLRDL